MTSQAAGEQNDRNSALARFLDMFDRDPSAAKACLKVGQHEPSVMKQMANDIPCPSLATTSYIEDVHERWQLVEEFIHRCALYNLSELEEFNATALAIFMVAPVPVIQSRVNEVHDANTAWQLFADLSYRSIYSIRRFLAKTKVSKTSKPTSKASTPITTPTRLATVATTSDAMEVTGGPVTPQAQVKRKASPSPTDTQSQKRKKVSRGGISEHVLHSQSLLASSPASSSRSPGKRSRAVILCAKMRDGNACLLSGLRDPEAAHVFPFSAASRKDARQSIDILLGFWGEEKLSSWRRLYEDRGITESAKNLICINEQLHLWWGSARFGLKPISATEHEVIVQFHWFRLSTYKPRDFIDITQGKSRTMRRLVGEETGDWDSGETMLAHRKSGLPIRTGQLFAITASNSSDLPSMELLELQWHLLRIAAMSGAADVTDDYYKRVEYSDEEDEDDAVTDLDLSDDSVSTMHLQQDLKTMPAEQNARP